MSLKNINQIRGKYIIINEENLDGCLGYFENKFILVARVEEVGEEEPPVVFNLLTKHLKQPIRDEYCDDIEQSETSIVIILTNHVPPSQCSCLWKPVTEEPASAFSVHSLTPPWIPITRNIKIQ